MHRWSPKGLNAEPGAEGSLSTKALVARVGAALAVLLLYTFSQSLGGRGYVTDVEATTFPAWHLIETGSLELSEHADRSHWFARTERGVWSNRAPGAIGFSVIGYALAAPFTSDYSPLPGNLIAVFTSWLAVLLIAASAERLRPGLWLPAIVLFGLGTATWSVSANQLWPHGPAQLAIAAALWFLMKDRQIASGLSFALAVLVRPPTIILGIGVAITKAIAERSMKPLVQIGGPAAISGTMFLLYTNYIFGSWNPVAGYESVGGFYGLTGIWERAVNIMEAFALPQHGILIWSSWIGLFLLYVYRDNQVSSIAWIRWTPLVAGLYVVLHSLFEVASGGSAYGYRYPLEALTLASPFLLTALPRVLSTPVLSVVALLAGSTSVFLQASYSFLFECQVTEIAIECSFFGT